MNDARPDGDEEMAISQLINKAGSRAEPSTERAQRVRAAVHEHWQANNDVSKPTAPWGWIAGIAAALLLSVGVFPQRLPATSGAVAVAHVLSQSGDVRIVGSTTALMPGSTIETGPGGMVNLRLASGHELRLQQETRVVIAAATRLSLARGTVYLDSGVGGTHDSMQVVTPFGNATDVGTQFEVSVDAQSIEVVVREGLVALENMPNSTRFDALVERGGGVRIDATGAATEFSVMPWDERWEWTNTLANFGKTTALGKEYIDWVVREYGLTLRLDGGDVAHRLTGEIDGVNPAVITDLNAELADALATIALQHRLEEDGVLVIFDPAQP